MGLDLAAGRREEGKKADTAHISLVGSREGSAWLGGKGASLLLTPAGEAGGGAERQEWPGEGPLRVAEQLWCSMATGAHWNRANGQEDPPGLARFPKVPASGIGAF